MPSLRPGHDFEPACFNWSDVNDTAAEGAFSDRPRCVSNLIEHDSIAALTPHTLLVIPFVCRTIVAVVTSAA